MSRWSNAFYLSLYDTIDTVDTMAGSLLESPLAAHSVNSVNSVSREEKLESVAEVAPEPAHQPLPKPGSDARTRFDVAQAMAVDGLMQAAASSNRCATCNAWGPFGFGRPIPRAWFCFSHRQDGEALLR